MTSAPPSSVILIPVHDLHPYLLASLQSVSIDSVSRLAHTHVVLDRPSNKLLEFITSFAINRPYFSFSVSPGAGLVDALNYGISVCKDYAFIFRFDSDDIMDPLRIEYQLDAFDRYPDVDVVGALATVLPINHNSTIKRPITYHSILSYAHYSSPVLHPTVAFRVTPEIMPLIRYDSTYLFAQDYALFARLLLSGFKFINLNRPLVYYRVHDQSDTRRNLELQQSQSLEISVNFIRSYAGLEKSPVYSVLSLCISRWLQLLAPSRFLPSLPFLLFARAVLFCSVVLLCLLLELFHRPRKILSVYFPVWFHLTRSSLLIPFKQLLRIISR